MTTDPKRVKEIFLLAAEQTNETARVAYLDRACGDDSKLRNRVEALLGSHDPAGSFLGTPAAAFPNRDGSETVALPPTPVPTPDSTRLGDGHSAEAEDDEFKSFLSHSSRTDSLGRIGHYEVLQVLGKGGFGIVFRAFDDILQRVVAIKVMAPQMAATSPARKRFLREARTSAAVRHDNVVQVYEVAEQPLPYLAMEFIPGETLQQRLDRSGPLEVAEIVRIGRQIAEGLAAAHATDLIHRDIKPCNILLEGGAQKVKITDFGLARAADDASISQSGIIAGTPMFMAPEQALGHTLDQRADLFSLGSVLYQMTTGRPPFRANGTLAVLKRVAEDTPRPIREVIPETPQWLCDIIAKLHEKNPDERFQSAREVADVLADCEAQLKANSKLKDFSRIPRSKQPAAAKSGRWKWAAAAVLLLPVMALAVTGLAGVTHFFRQQQAKTNPTSISTAQETPSWRGWPAEGPNPAIAPFDAAQAKKHQEEWAAKLQLPVEFMNSIGMKLRLIPPGEYTMGSRPEEVPLAIQRGMDLGVNKDFMTSIENSSLPQHKVRLTSPFQLGTCEVTVGQFREFVKAAKYRTTEEKNNKGEANWQQPPSEGTDRKPVTHISRDDAMAFCGWLSEREGRQYTLPTEAQWEFACRAGSQGNWCFGDDSAELDHYAWSGLAATKGPADVGQKRQNGFGLFDMHGNVQEWCLDWHVGDFYLQSPLMDPVCSDKDRRNAQGHVVRGGWWQRADLLLRSSARSYNVRSSGPSYGFRVAIIGDLKPPPVTKPEPLPLTFKNGIGMEFVVVPKGKSWLGGVKDRLGDQEVEIPADFFLGKYEVTQEEWEKVMGSNPSHFSRTGLGKNAVKDISDADLKRFPVENVSWEQCQVFVEKLNKSERESGWVYRLPKADEWEYACRGGPMADKADSAFDYYFEKPTNAFLPTQANFSESALNRTCMVGSYKPNALGLFDLHGNLSEWCDDIEKATTGGSLRVLRGGGWGGRACRVTTHFKLPEATRNNIHGLRLARVPAGGQ